jgi:hypothetical protein
MEAYERKLMTVTMVAFPVPVSKIYYHWNRGLEQHGDRLIQLAKWYDLRNENFADCYYQTNEKKKKFFTGNRYDTQGKYFDYILESKKPFIVSESNPFRQHEGWMRFGWSSYKWTEGNFNNDNVDRTRWKRFEKITGITFTDWKSPGDNILIMGQKEGDSALNSMYDKGYEHIYDWMFKTVLRIRNHTDRPIVIRPHPRGMKKGFRSFKSQIEKKGVSNVSWSEAVEPNVTQGGAGLDHDLNNAHCVVTYNSLSSIEAVIKGIPVFAMDDGCMAYPISHTDLSQIENINYNIDITDWQNKIAYTMWNKKDVQTGRAWAHLKPVYFP